MTADEARAWKHGWELVREREIAALRSTPLDVKLQQLSTLLEAARLLGWLQESAEDAAAVESIRRRWARLKGEAR